MVTASASRDRISVDLRGLKAALIEQARAQGVTPSDFIRALLAESLGEAAGHDAVRVSAAGNGSPGPRARLSLRMHCHEAQLVRGRARAAGMPVGAFVAGLCGGVPALAQGQRPIDQAAALAASSAELSTLARDLRHLTQLLRQADAPAARVYRARLESTERDVRTHLAQAAALMADLRPLRSRFSAARGINP